MRYRFCAIAALSAACAAIFPGKAATATSTFQVSATVVKACAISATALAFGNYDPTAASPDDATSTIDVKCTNGTPYSIGLNAGTAPGASVTSRKMTNGANALGYALYQDSGHTTNWGNAFGPDMVSGTAGASTTTLTVYGRIPQGQNVPVGTFADTVTAIISY